MDATSLFLPVAVLTFGLGLAALHEDETELAIGAFMVSALTGWLFVWFL